MAALRHFVCLITICRLLAISLTKWCASVQVKRKGQREQLSSTEGTQKAQLSKRLVTIQTDVDLPPTRQAAEPVALEHDLAFIHAAYR